MLTHPYSTHIRSLFIYGVALVSRIDKITSLFCNRALSKRQYSAKKTYNFMDPKNRSHPRARERWGAGVGSSTIFKKFNEPYAPS